MREEAIMKAGRRLQVLTKIEDKKLSMTEGAIFLGMSVRHLRRLKVRASEGGISGLLYQRRHRAVNSASEEEVGEILKLRKELYRSYNLLHVRDTLKGRHEIDRCREFYRKLFLKHGLYAPVQKRRKGKHRKRFEAPQAGLLVQRDTSIHLWIPGLEKPWKLILDLDDHSRLITGALFSEHDDVFSNMLVAWETISTHGVPTAYYADNNPIFNPLNQKPKLGHYQFIRMRDGEQEESLSQFKRALQELGIKLINATPYQPQGKGKIERIFRFLQDRLVNEMITAKVKTIAEANRYLKKWVAWYNGCHLHSTTGQIPITRYKANNAFQPLPENVDLRNIFCLKHERQVKADNTFSYEGIIYQLKASPKRVSFAKTTVEIRIDLSKKLHVWHKNDLIGSFPMGSKKHKLVKDLRSKEDILALHL